MIEVELEINAFGTKRYYIKGTGIYHREDGAAVEYANGDKSWYQYGKYHRLDGPAVECTNGYREFWINNKHIENVRSIEEAIIKSLLE